MMLVVPPALKTCVEPVKFVDRNLPEPGKAEKT
jgi:hypothetical protein